MSRQPDRNLLPADGLATLRATFLDRGTADRLFDRLREELDWAQEKGFLFGRRVALPRRTAWYGPAAYSYSGVTHPAQALPPVLEGLAAALPADQEVRPDSVLANLYRNGGDSMGWHSDDEALFGDQPAIWSVSLGATRRFSFRHRSMGVRVDVDLPHGSLLLMSGECQRYWHHALPKTARQVGPRINLTYRRTVSTH